MFLMASRAVQLVMVVRWTIMASATCLVSHRVHIRIGAQQPGHRLERLDMTDATMVVEHCVGTGYGAGFVDEARPGPPGERDERHAAGKDRPGQDIANSPNAARLPKIIELDPIR